MEFKDSVVNDTKPIERSTTKRIKDYKRVNESQLVLERRTSFFANSSLSTLNLGFPVPYDNCTLVSLQ